MKTYKDVHGWFNFPDFYDQVFKEFKNKDEALFVEMGVWLGKSVIYMADKIKKHNHNITFVAIDNFKGNENPNPVGGLATPTQISNEKYDGDFYDVFYQNLVDCGVEDFVQPKRMNSLEAVKDFGDETIDFVFIDGDHHYNAVIKDLNVWYPKVKKGGIFSGHDIKHVGVIKALSEFCRENKVKKTPVSKTCWMIRK